MGDLLGIIAPLKKFMSNSYEEVYVSVGGEKRIILSLNKDRIYDIPDFQREIRWSSDNVALLIEDIKSGPKFLGNIILTKHTDNRYSIIDGQQRITILTMVLHCIKQLHESEIDIINPCKLTIESFSKFPTLIEQGFDQNLYTDDVYKSDKLKQILKYTELWKFILDAEEIKNRQKAKKIIENLGACSFNIIINEADDVGEGIRYFIDVNLKGKQLDVEDIFKSYLFKNDSGKEVRNQWYLLKTSIADIERSKMDYSLIKLLEHYFLCDLYQNKKYKGMEFGTDFLLKKAYRENDITHREGTHLIEVVNDNQYMRTSLERINKIVELMLCIVNSNSLTTKIEEVFTSDIENEHIDNVELKVIHNIISKILKDTKVLPKSLLIKYFIILLYSERTKSKECIRTIYGIYLFSVLFSVFENKKSAEVLVNIIKASTDTWYLELVKQINDYFALDRITDARLLTQYKFGQNEDEEDQRFRCKSLATVYNFFVNQNGKVKIRKGKMNELYKFITDDSAYSIEHFIISETKSKKITVDGNEYTIDDAIYKRYVNNFFNFIFIEQQINTDLGNSWLPEKLEKLKNKNISCEYSFMVVDKAAKLGSEFEKRSGDDYKDKLDLFFAREFKDVYIEYTKDTLDGIIRRINGYMDAMDI